MDCKVAAIILAAGSGKRMGTQVTKQRLILGGSSILCRTVKAISDARYVSDIYIVARDDEIDFARDAASVSSKVKMVVKGGDTRAESAKNGFDALSGRYGYVAIHDGARCFVKPDDVDRVIADAMIYGAATASTTVTDTVKTVDSEGKIKDHLDRRTLRAVQTPQVFRTDIYAKALNSQSFLSEEITDDNMLVSAIGVKVHCTETDRNNIKITSKGDLFLGELILKEEGSDG